MSNKKGGCPPKYKTVKAMQEAIDNYFKKCDGEYIRDEEGNLLTDKNGNPVKKNSRPYTITGLALELGFTSRQALLNYEAKEKFVDTIKKAKARVEQYAEERLFDREGANGAKFNLSNNFKGWSEKQQIDSNVNMAPVVFSGSDDIED